MQSHHLLARNYASDTEAQSTHKPHNPTTLEPISQSHVHTPTNLSTPPHSTRDSASTHGQRQRARPAAPRQRPCAAPAAAGTARTGRSRRNRRVTLPPISWPDLRLHSFTEPLRCALHPWDACTPHTRCSTPQIETPPLSGLGRPTSFLLTWSVGCHLLNGRGALFRYKRF